MEAEEIENNTGTIENRNIEGELEEKMKVESGEVEKLEIEQKAKIENK